MKVVAAPDSFKGSLSAVEAARAIANGVRRADATALVDEVPLADGGEGLVEALVTAGKGVFVEARVLDPLGREIAARYGMLPDDTAVIEMAAASGLPLLRQSERNPLETTTYGTGQLLQDAIARGARKVILGIGGSATVDGGTGMARALGVRFLDAEGRVLEGGGEILPRIASIDATGLDGRVRKASITVACDVTNPLTGPTGAAVVYGPQKGATPEQVAALDAGLANLAQVIRRQLGIEVEALPGAGAAGGLGAGLLAFLGARLERGIEIVRRAVGLDSRIAAADVVFTGEGRADGQSAFGKAVAGVADAARAAHVPVILLAGSVGDGAESLYSRGVSAIFSIARGPASEDEMMRDAAALVEFAAEGAMRAFLAGRERMR